jgi:hypothetical protein
LKTKRSILTSVAMTLVVMSSLPVQAETPALSPSEVAAITAPVQAFPQDPGSDYFLANYTQYEAYLKQLAGESTRMKLESFGTTAEGRTQWMAIVSSPENLAQLERYKNISRRLAKAEDLTEEEAAQLAAEGKSIVWIDAGLHSTETVTTQSQIQVLYRLLTRNDPETLRTLDDVIVIFGHVNPDGTELVANWYMRNANPEDREFGSIPRLYHKYAGHDNNRDSYISNLPETENANRVYFREWFPQIIFNQHQTGPRGMVVFVPPFRDPFNYNYDPLVMTSTTEVGTIIHSRLISEGKSGSGMDSVAPYSTWHNGMYRSTPYFHNSIGILTEIIGGPTPENIPLLPDTQLARNDEPMPVAPRLWHLRDSLEYQWTINRAVIDYASRNRERLLMGIYRMGENSIQRGSRDSWTVTPKDIDALKEAGANSMPAEGAETPDWARSDGQVNPALYDTILHNPANRDARGYILSPTEQHDMPATVAFVNALIKSGVDVDRATAAFTVGGKRYPAGSFVVKAAQAYRPHVLDMFEPQDHPHNLAYPGGPPKLPYDVAGYTLAYQMGVSFDRILEGFDGPFQRLSDVVAPPAGSVVGTGRAGWLIGHDTNNSFILTNRLLKAGVPVFWLKEASRAGNTQFEPGAIWVPASAEAANIIQSGVGTLGINAYAVGAAPTVATLALKPIRIGLVDRYGGVMSSGWTRWMLEQYEFPFEVVYPQRLDGGDLNSAFDVLVFTDGTTPALAGGPYRPSRGGALPAADTIPAAYRNWLGEVTEQTTLPQIDAFVRGGGTVLTIGGANRLATLLNAPVQPALFREVNGQPTTLRNEDFFIPGSVLRARIDNTQPLAYGMTSVADVFFANGQTFHLDGPAAHSIAWFDTAEPLRSGWGHGQERLKDTVAVADVDLGKGKLFVYGAEVTQRAQPLGTFKLFFNGLLYGPASSR